MGRDLAIDLGTANTLVFVTGRGIVLNEPTVIALNRENGQVLAMGQEAYRMIGRTPGYIVAERPLRRGAITDFEVTERYIRLILERVGVRKRVPRPRVLICVPSAITEVERRAVQEATMAAGAREAYLIEEPVAAAIGAGLPISEPVGNLVRQIVDAVVAALSSTPPELAQDILSHGIALTGGGGLLRGLEARLAQECDVPVQVASRPLECVVLGAGKCVASFNEVKDLFVSSSSN